MQGGQRITRRTVDLGCRAKAQRVLQRALLTALPQRAALQQAHDVMRRSALTNKRALRLCDRQKRGHIAIQPFKRQRGHHISLVKQRLRIASGQCSQRCAVGVGAQHGQRIFGKRLDGAKPRCTQCLGAGHALAAIKHLAFTHQRQRDLRQHRDVRRAHRALAANDGCDAAVQKLRVLAYHFWLHSCAAKQRRVQPNQHRSAHHIGRNQRPISHCVRHQHVAVERLR